VRHVAQQALVEVGANAEGGRGDAALPELARVRRQVASIGAARPESFKVSADRIALVGHMNPDAAGWRERANLIFRDPSWQFANIGQLKEAQRREKQSMGIVTPGEIVDVRAVAKTAKERTEWDEKMLQVQIQGDLFRPEYKELEFPSHDIRLRWRCSDPCDECTDLRTHDFRLFMGNFFLHQHIFGIIGMWYPKIPAQPSLL
jgi:hypothetical protein